MIRPATVHPCKANPVELASKYGEDHFIVMFGRLDIEMAVLKTIGDLLQDSGWTGALVQAGVATPGWTWALVQAMLPLLGGQGHSFRPILPFLEQLNLF